MGDHVVSTGMGSLSPRAPDPLPGFGAAWNLTEPISSSGHPFPLTLPSPRRRGRSVRRATTNCGAGTFPAMGQAPSPLGRGSGEGERGSRRFRGIRISELGSVLWHSPFLHVSRFTFGFRAFRASRHGPLEPRQPAAAALNIF